MAYQRTALAYNATHIAAQVLLDIEKLLIC